MSATEQAVPGRQAEASPGSGIFHPGLGDKLTRAREALGLGIVDVAAKLKLSERQIEAMEAEDFAQLPGEVFSRGFVRNYARLLKLDPEQLIIPVDVHAAVAETITAPSEGVIFASPGLRRWVLLPLLALGFFVLLVALI
jgi:cytoskeleton protein RodZ